MEPNFYADLVALLELPDDLPDQNDQSAMAADEGRLCQRGQAAHAR